MQTYAWQPESVAHYPLIEYLSLAPDGRTVVYTTRTAYMTDETSEYHNQLWLATTDGSQPPRQLTFGQNVTWPRFSPDGHWIAFLRPDEKDKAKPRVWLMPAAGGEACPLSGEANGVKNAVLNLKWSPDGQRLALIALPWDEAREARKRSRDDVIHHRVDYDFPHLYVMNVSDSPDPALLPTVRQLTSGRVCVREMDWSPDGATLVLTYMPTPLADDWPQTRIGVIAADGNQSSPRELGMTGNWMPNVAWSPDGQWIAAAVSTQHGRWAHASQVVLFSPDGDQHRHLASTFDGQPGWSAMTIVPSSLLAWSPDSQTVYTNEARGTQIDLLALPVNGSPAYPLCNEAKMLTYADVNRKGQAVLVLQNFDEVNSLYMANLAEAAMSVVPRKIVQPAPVQYRRGPIPQTRILRWHTPDDFEIEGILYLPADYQSERDGRIPLLLNIHGGPTGAFLRFDAGRVETYSPAYFCERGIAVLRPNPRGSSGYGKTFRFANYHDWGGGDYCDIQQGVDTVIEMGIADPDRLGICGWSYGGFMTSWAITQTDRFQAASIGAAVTNPMSFCGTADIPAFIPDYFGREAWEDLDFYRAHSPIFQVEKAKTPSIIQHGDADVRVPLEQGLQLYNALKRRDVPVEMYIYPRQGHAILEPRMQIDVLRRNLEWFTEKLK